MQLKNTITLSLELYALKTRIRSHLFKNEPIFVIAVSMIAILQVSYNNRT